MTAGPLSGGRGDFHPSGPSALSSSVPVLEVAHDLLHDRLAVHHIPKPVRQPVFAVRGKGLLYPFEIEGRHKGLIGGTRLGVRECAVPGRKQAISGLQQPLTAMGPTL